MALTLGLGLGMGDGFIVGDGDTDILGVVVGEGDEITTTLVEGSTVGVLDDEAP